MSHGQGDKKVQVNTEEVGGQAIRVTGVVQGVGFRPFVWQLAKQLQLTGQVYNDAGGVLIQVWGERALLNMLQQQLRQKPPPLAKIDDIQVTPLTSERIPKDFLIVESKTGEVRTDMSPDRATCPDCLAEIQDPTNRRYRYPFSNCTHCGPRLSIIHTIPYDRKHTSMRSFTMCSACQQEYHNPKNRRFHAQPNACPTCGPVAWLEDHNGQRVKDSTYLDAVAHAAALIQQGAIIAIKGVGGFHLACDATQAEVVRRLRQRKRRYQKPFAMMARDISIIKNYARMDPIERQLLLDRAAPVVLLSALQGNGLPEAIAPDQNTLGFMLPYTPLHTLLLQDFLVPLVMTSGNRSDEAQCIENQQAREHLQEIADYFFMHNRDIVNRLDDSVARVVGGKTQLIRRARGYTPEPIHLPKGFKSDTPILAMGAELKNAFCLVKQGKAILSQHQGDLEDLSVFQDYEKNIQLFLKTYQHKPTLIAMDQHPEYLSSKWGTQMAAQFDADVLKIQHHHAHIAACMAEHGLPLHGKAVLGIAFDGLGYAEPNEIWGGEFFIADYHSAERVASIQPIALPGGTRALLEPWRNTFAHLHQTLGWNNIEQHYSDLDFIKYLSAKPISNLIRMIDQGINSPPASSKGRLFDAVAAILGLCPEQLSYEGQAAIALEVSASRSPQITSKYPVHIVQNQKQAFSQVNWGPLWEALLQDIQNKIPVTVIAAKFHQTIISMITDRVEHLQDRVSFEYVVLSGGVFQNRLLLEGVIKALSKLDVTVLYPRRIPANDGGIAFGQAVIATAKLSSTR